MKKWGYLVALLIVLETLNAALYLSSVNQPGFPLDDAWIHQTYARNLGSHGIMAFSPGVPSTGSTSPGWTVLLAAGYKLNASFLDWAYLWGSIFAIATAFAAALLSHCYFGDFKRAAIVGVICIFEWHLAWAALSGMEINLFTFLTLLTLLMTQRNSPPYLMGLVTGLTFLVRPEGFFLGAIYGLKLMITNRNHPGKFLFTVVTFTAVLLIVVTPWIIFNLNYGGRPFPNTISSKFIQYGYPWSLWHSLKYLWNVIIYFLNGPLMLLVPSMGFAIYRALSARKMDFLYPLAWPLILIGLYAVALPAIYHHGRYLMPLIPLLVVYGVEGLSKLLEKLPVKSLLRPTMWLTLGAMIFVLWVNGASTFALQTELLNDSHMQAARWVDVNTPMDAIIATHDIGIVGYITQRQIVDLAGLVTPQVIPIMGDQIKLAEYVRERHVTYLIVFSGYYREMLAELDTRLLYSPNMVNLNALQLEPFEVFEIQQP